MKAPKETKEYYHGWRQDDGKYNWKGFNKKKAEIKVLTIPDIRFYSSSDSSRLCHEKKEHFNMTESKAIKLSTPSNLVHKLYKLKKKFTL